ncbi:MAG: winged helix-turn-helix domain-containing protein, partial [Lysobacterales bacterium]
MFDCLAYLIEHRERAIGRDELVAAVWGKTEISDTLLGQTVLRIRRELGDDGKDPRIVRTIPRFGYCWIAAVDTVPGNHALRSTDAAGVTVPSANAQPPALPASGIGGVDSVSAIGSRTRPIVFLAALLAVVALAVVAWRVSSVRSAAEHGSATKPQFALAGAAVVPAGVEPGTDPEWSWLRFGVMDVVATRLRSAGLPTVPSENIIALLNAPSTRQHDSLRDVAGFRLLVTPRATQVGGSWQIHLDADDGAGQHATVEASARDATEAARLAANKLLVVLGREAPAAVGEQEPNAQLVKRVDAAVLADDPAAARALIEQAPASQQRTPELRLRLAKIDFRGGRTSAARDRLLALLDEAPAQTAPVLRAAILNGLGAVAIRSDQPAAAERYFAEAVDLLAPRAEPAQLGEAYLGRAGAA